MRVWLDCLLGTPADCGPEAGGKEFAETRFPTPGFEPGGYGGRDPQHGVTTTHRPLAQSTAPHQTDPFCTHASSLQVRTPSAPDPSLPTATPAALEGAGSILLEAGDYTCNMPSCRGAWRITCGASGPRFNRTGFTTQLTAGVGPSFNLDLAALARSGAQQYSCTAVLLVIDAANQVTTTNTTFAVRRALRVGLFCHGCDARLAGTPAASLAAMGARGS